MVDVIEIAKLRYRMAGILKSRGCLQVRFQLDNISIQTYMYSYIADAILSNQIHISIGGGNHYDHRINTINFSAIDVDATAIVHESTHAVIDATHKGLSLSTGTGEAVAYLAEAVYGLVTNQTKSTDVRFLDRPIFQLAQAVVAFNLKNPSGLFVCPSSNTFEIKAILNTSGLSKDMEKAWQMDGIGDGT